MPPPQLELVGKLVGKNDDGKNESGFVLSLRGTNGWEQEFVAVAFERKNALHPDVSYEDKRQEVLADAERTIDDINRLWEKYDRSKLQ